MCEVTRKDQIRFTSRKATNTSTGEKNNRSQLRCFRYMNRKSETTMFKIFSVASTITCGKRPINSWNEEVKNGILDLKKDTEHRPK